ncbi:GNAT family N-acetyltransferase [Cellulomonas sp. PhB150]|uniref:GNAT family N-acetyltransferase n=1 Tax=Cellulomonas sp. PhB150 TaxID=2485188 RepID=UPI000F486E09|nr:GNAT family N-acetyltransferase [Cellulomonas sp. PhB150]ROS23823.1 acetyltransferase (GNAT) family protein [Cellulomonas sp. PhB150]
MPRSIRPFHPSDLGAIYRICLLTGHAGGDSSHLYANPDLLSHLYAGPYPVADPGMTFVVADEQGVAGYIVATADSAGFERWREEHWWPVLRAQYPLVEDPHDGTEDHVLVARFHETWPTEDPVYAEYPAHMHIDLLPRLQGQGLGRALIETLADALRARGVPGLHLGVSKDNPGAIAFYHRVGFVTLEEHAWGLTLGLALG